MLLYYIILCYVMLCCILLCYIMLYYIILHYIMLYYIIYIRRGESFGLSDKSNPAYFWKKASPFHRSKTFQRVALTTFGTLMNINIAGRWMPHAPQNLIDRYIDPYVYIYIYILIGGS